MGAILFLSVPPPPRIVVDVAKPVLNDNKLDDQDLVDVYDVTNARFFDLKLPREPVVKFKVMKGYLGQTFDPGGLHPVIWINPLVTPSEKEAAMVLKHEMCHIYVNHLPEVDAEWDISHGKPFQSCMRKLASKGAFALDW